MTSSSPAAPPPLSLSRVRQADPACCELIDQSVGPCDLYLCGQHGWTKCQAELNGEQGRLVLYSRSESPRHALAVIGCGPTDRVQPLAPTADAADGARAQPPFILFGGGGSGGGRRGVWFRDEADCHRLARRLALIAAEANVRAAAPPSGPSGPAPMAGESIVEMLGRAQAQYKASTVVADSADTCEMVARRIREQLGLTQPEERSAAAAETASATAAITVDTVCEAETAAAGLTQDGWGLTDECTSPPPADEEFLLTPGMLESPPQRSQPDGEDTKVATPDAASAPSSSTGTREHLRDSLVHLLEQDDAFIGSVHRAYIASLQKRLSAV